jgi:hypothetical protein
MREYNLGFISDQALFDHTKETILKYKFSANLKNFNENLIDPIKLTFDSKIYKKEMKALIEDEVSRQMDKSNTNHIGYFHQNIFKYIGTEWVVPDEGFDVVNPSQQIYVEMKNKHNTMNSSSAKASYIKMQNQVLQEPNSTCMLVEVIAKYSQNIEWSLSIDKQTKSHPQIRRVSIDKFYEIVTSDANAFMKLCKVLPVVIDDILESQHEEIIQNTVFEELNQISPNILKSLYLLSFSKYNGFDLIHFDI